VEVKAITLVSGISIYPNPIENKTAQLYFENMPAGTYQINLYNINGQLIGLYSKKINSTLAKESLELSSGLASGEYQLEFISANGFKTIKNILVK
jgi:hypothetical protein